MMKILITGGEGYIGSWLTKKFLDDGHIVTTLDNCSNTKPIFNFTKYSHRLIRHQASTSNPDAVGRAMQGVNVIYHLAARYDWENVPRHALRLVETNVQGTATVLTMARKVGVDKVIIASSSEVYGNIINAKPTDPCTPVNMVGATKLAAEAICRGFYQTGLDVIILRLYNVWGGNNSISVVNKFATGDGIIYGDGYQTRDFVHINDVIKALQASLNWDPNIYNIATGEEITINGLWHIINPDLSPKYKSDAIIGYEELHRSCGNIDATPWKPDILMSQLNSETIRLYAENL